MAITKMDLKQQVINELDQLPFTDVAEVLDFARFLKMSGAQRLHQRRLPSVPASHLERWTGLVAWGGDAVEDSERLYDFDVKEGG